MIPRRANEAKGDQIPINMRTSLTGECACIGLAEGGVFSVADGSSFATPEPGDAMLHCKCALGQTLEWGKPLLRFSLNTILFEDPW